MNIETQIATVRGNANAIVRLLESELLERVVYLHRARLLISLARDTIAVMDQVEALGVASDFDDPWRKTRGCLKGAKSNFERIVAFDADVSLQPPCKTKAPGQ